MSKIRNLPELTSLQQDDLLYAVEESVGTNGGRRVKVSTIRTAVELTDAEVKTKYENNPDTNAFTDAEKTKLAGIETGATADQIASEVPYNNTSSGLSATNVQDAIDQVNTKAQADFIPSIVSGRILHYSGGTARFDGTFFQLVAGDILLNSNITDGEVYVDLDGLVKQTASSTQAPPYTIVFAKFSTDLNDIISLTDERVKNAQNIIRGLVTDIEDVNAGDTAYEGDSGRIADAAHRHRVLTGAPSTQAPDQSNAEGSSTNLARADHIHNIPADAPTITLSPATSNAEGSGTSFARNDHTHAIATSLVGDLSIINAGDTASAGIVDKFARGDHQHAVATGAASTIDANSTNTEGSSTNLARADHTHAISTGVPSTQNPDQSNAAGSSANLARADHIHNIPADAPTITLSPATSNAEGVGTSFARNDHTHAIATGLAADISTIQPDDIAAAGTLDKFARADHKHAIVAATVSTQNADQSNAEGSSTSFARADHIHNIPTAAPTDIGSANAQGSASTFVKSDHVHKGVHSVKANVGSQRFGDLSLVSGNGSTVTDDGSGNFTIETVLGGNELFVTQGSGLTANYTAGKVRINGTSYSLGASSLTVATGATNGRIYVDVDGVVKSTTSTTTPANAAPLAIFSSSGVAITALSDNRTVLNVNVMFGASGDIANLNATNSAAAGSTNKYADAGHVHTISTGAASSQTPDQSNAAGSSANLARADHVHNIATAAATSISTSTSNAQGAAATFARSDHTHAVSVTNQEATATADDTTTSVTDTLMNSMTATPASGTYLVMWNGSIVNSANGSERTWVSLYLNGSQVSATERSIGTSGGAYSPSSTHAIITTPGSQAIELRWRVAAGTSTVHSRRLTLVKLS